ncbi:ABC-type dipeptide/oligopeptide/nickel transport system ATPase component [Antricoccus suffuscus]|uniref:ABC-type dipeptide/oligopeptide/nickel transport system ATPase component n=1 Tax=Antricoccus suffuscus TaxID=1629062 RepID=A0A2T0ZZE8_9ACTN|nr:ABC transporter ATP-binding protein [Antricoccus suffuscus]PRZ41468.1 ABC-type dipeptide/oligopeptide/nickel transport system ATPase component [Antricoccus suffuscus]
MSEQPLLDVRGLTVKFGDSVAVDDLSFTLGAGEILAIVGESGSGKSVTAMSIMRLIELSTTGKIISGEINLRQPDGSVIDLCRTSESQLRRVRGNAISMIFQEPLTCLNPLYTVGNQIIEAITTHRPASAKAAHDRCLELMDMVRIPEAARRIRQYPHELSGGMRQRVMIAMALACEPRIIIADEPTTALDVTIQAQILSLILDLRDRIGAAVIFITHDMGVVAEVADRVLVMRRSKFVEEASVMDIFSNPQEAYTKDLLAAVPRLGSMSGKTKPERFVVSGAAL